MPWIIRSFLLVGLLAVSSCQSEPVVQPPITFTRYQPIHMAVATIDIIEEYKSSRKAPYVEHLIPYSPAEAMRIWVDERLRAVGSEKSLQIVIKDGSVTMTPLGKTLGMEGFFTVEPDKRYDAKLVVEMRIYSPGSAMSEASIVVSASRSITLLNSATLNQRDAQLRGMVASLMNSINAEIEKNLYQYMSGYVSYFQNP